MTSIEPTKPAPELASSSAASQVISDEQGTPAAQAPEASEFTLRATLALAGTATGLFMTVGVANAFGVFEQYYYSTLLPEKTEFQIAWIGSFSTFMMFATAAPVGIMADKFGPRPLLIAGSAIQVFSWFMLSLCKEYYQIFLVQGLLQGFGFALITIPAASITPLYFKKNKAAAQGMTIAGSSLGGVIWPIVLEQLLKTDGMSFGSSTRIVAYILLPLAGFVILTVVRPPTAKVVDKEGQQTSEKPSAPPKDYSALRRPAALLLVAGLGLCFFGFFAPLFFVSTYAVSLGISESFAFYLVSIANAASLFGRILPGFYADRSLGAFNTLILSCIVSGVVAFCWTAATSTAGIVLWILAYGFASGAILSLEIVCIVSLMPRHMAGTAIGMAFSAISVPALFGSPIAGQLAVRGYARLSCFTGAVLLAGGVLVLGSRLALDRRLWVKV